MKKTQLLSIIYNVFFLLRRLAFAFVTVFVGNSDAGLALCLVVLINLFYNLYLIQIKPHDSFRSNLIESTSELLL